MSLHKTRNYLPLLLLAFVLVSCDALSNDGTGELAASGVVEATEVTISPAIGGRVAEVAVSEGESVDAGDILLRMEGRILEAQWTQAQTAVEAAIASLDTAHAARATASAGVELAAASLSAAELQAQMTLAAARLLDQPARELTWDRDFPTEFSLPDWYFELPEQIQAAVHEVEEADTAWQAERENFDQVAGGADLRAAETRLAEAQVAFLVAEQLRNRRIDAQDRAWVRDYVDDLYDAAVAELESASEAYESLLSEDAADDLLEARARLTVAHQRLATAQDELDKLLTGEHSREVQLALIGSQQAATQLRQAEASVAQADAQLLLAERAVDQARAALALIELQMEDLTVEAPVSGVVLTRTVEPGELLQPGMVAVTIGQLDDLRVTVFLPEDRYGQVSLGDTAYVTVDSYPGESFEAVVTRIADRAEFTPRNVQTEEDRRSTVYAIVLRVDDPDGRLKPGMPADVEFSS
ncbi:MAG: HlyD family secretion protein [Anaerolineales bacterium]